MIVIGVLCFPFQLSEGYSSYVGRRPIPWYMVMVWAAHNMGVGALGTHTGMPGDAASQT